MKDLVCIDFETYYANDYSLALAKYNTSEYIRDDQFLIHGVGIACTGHQPYWIAGHDEALAECHKLELDKRPVVAHNMAFDGFILHEHAGIHCNFYCDTLSMARAAIGHHTKHSLNDIAKLLALGAKLHGLEDTKNLRSLPEMVARRLGQYCVQDVQLCSQIFWKLLPYVPEEEMQLIDLTLRMFCQPQLLVDENLTRQVLVDEQANKKAALSATSADLSVLMSNQKFATLLEELGVDPPLKISPRTKKYTYAFAKTDDGFKELLNHPNEEVRFAAEARLQVKSTINETRAERLLRAGENGQPLPVLLNYAGAHTFRWSGGNKLNLQNFPRGSDLRRAIMAPEGHQLLVFDLAQIEARITAWLAGQDEVVNAFRNGDDVYKIMASRIYGKPVDRITKDERFIGKVCILGLGYGMGWKKLQMTLKMGFMGPPVEIDDYQAKHIIWIYRSANNHIVRLWDQLSALIQRMSLEKNLHKTLGSLIFMYRMIELPNGLALKYPGLTLTEEGPEYQSRYGTTKIWGGKLLENIVQALARCVIAEQILQISKKYFVATMTHDEVVCIVPDEQIEIAYKEVEQIMTTPPSWAPTLPLSVDGDYDVRYSK